MPITKDQNRPTFTFNNQPVRAAGLLLYTVQDKEPYYLMRSGKKRDWSDIGGKTDIKDADILSTIVREVTEETNNKLFSPYHGYEQAYELLDLILRNQELTVFYSPKAKYILVKVEMDSSLKNLPMKRFGLKEKTDGWEMNHYFKWIKNIQRHKMHPRLKYHKDFYNIFKNTV
jgi:hypothetical protein